MGLLRLLTTEAVMREDVLSSRKAWNVYRSILEDDRIQFAPEPFLLEQDRRLPDGLRASNRDAVRDHGPGSSGECQRNVVVGVIGAPVLVSSEITRRRI